MRIHTYIHLYRPAYIYMYTYTNSYIMYEYNQAFICTHMYTYTQVHIYTQIRVYAKLIKKMKFLYSMKNEKRIRSPSKDDKITLSIP